MRNKLSLLFLTFSLLTACASNVPTPGLELPTPTFTLQVSPTPSDPLVILILPADMPQSDSDTYQTLIYNLAQQNRMRFQVRNTLTVDELQAELPSLKIVITLPPDPGLAELVTSAPEVQFLAVAIPDLPSAANLTVIGGADQAVDKQAFLAGYISAMLASEWRVGILSEKDTTDGESARLAFINGFHFFCGFCRNQDFTQPYYDYPIVIRIPTDAPESEYTGYAAAMLDYWVNTAFVYPGLATPDLLSYLAEYGVLLVGQELPREELRANWIASIQPNIIPAIQNLFPELLAGRGGQVIPTPLYLTDVNSSLLTEGKLRLAQEVLDNLQNGTIGTGVTP